MPDILIQTGGSQGTSSPTIVYDQLVSPSSYQGSSQACLIDLTPPTFAGIATLTIQPRGQFRVTWLAGSDATAPVRYEVYIKPHTSVGLFNAANIIGITDKLMLEIFTLQDGTFLLDGTTYYVGVKAIDGVGNRDANAVILNMVSQGIAVFSDTYKASGAFAISPTNQFQGTLWVTKNGQLDPTVTLGFASYQIYDRSGVLVSGMAEANISADVNGQYKITPVTSTLTATLDHYMVKVTIKANENDRVDYVPLIQKAPEYDISGLFGVNAANTFDGTFWASADEKIKTTGISAGSYQVFDHDGAAVVGMSETGITPSVDGIFRITNIPSTLSEDFLGYSVRVSLTIDGIVRSEMFAIQGKLPNYEVKAIFSINALDQLRATLWVTKDGIIETGSLGTANYTVRDADGNTVAGLTQSGITGDVNGLYKITPVSAVGLSDLTHYTVKCGIVVQGIERISYRGFSLLGN